VTVKKIGRDVSDEPFMYIKARSWDHTDRRTHPLSDSQALLERAIFVAVARDCFRNNLLRQMRASS